MEKRQIFAYESDINDFNGIIPALKAVPQWYKRIPKKVTGKSMDHEHEEDLVTVKSCVPFLDAFTTGYFMTLGQELLVERTEIGPVIRYKTEPNPTGFRPSALTDPMPTPTGYGNEHFVWHTTATVKLPPGYSALYTHPINRFELPFFTVSAVVDADTGIPGGNIPFYLKENFEGIIPKGTPIIQIIPFKRDEWISKKVTGAIQEARAQQARGPHDWYRKFGWKRKSFK